MKKFHKADLVRENVCIFTVTSAFWNSSAFPAFPPISPEMTFGPAAWSLHSPRAVARITGVTITPSNYMLYCIIVHYWMYHGICHGHAASHVHTAILSCISSRLLSTSRRARALARSGGSRAGIDCDLHTIARPRNRARLVQLVWTLCPRVAAVRCSIMCTPIMHSTPSKYLPKWHFFF